MVGLPSADARLWARVLSRGNGIDAGTSASCSSMRWSGAQRRSLGQPVLPLTRATSLVEDLSEEGVAAGSWLRFRVHGTAKS